MILIEDWRIVSLADEFHEWISVMGDRSASTLLGSTLADLGRDNGWCLRDVCEAIDCVVNLHYIIYGPTRGF